MAYAASIQKAVGLQHCTQQETHQEMRLRTWTFFTTTSYTHYKIQ